MSKLYSLLIVLGLVLFSTNCFAEKSQRSTTAEKPLKVKGQSRSFARVLTQQRDRSKIRFIKVRKNYFEEIVRTPR